MDGFDGNLIIMNIVYICVKLYDFYVIYMYLYGSLYEENCINVNSFIMWYL